MTRLVGASTGVVPVIQRVLADADATEGRRVMLLDMKEQPIAKGTIVGPLNNNNGTVLVQSGKTTKPRKLTNLRLLTAEEAQNDNSDDLPKAASNYSDEVKKLLVLWGLPADDAFGARLGAPSRRVVELAAKAHTEFSEAPVTGDRTVYVKEGSFSDAEALLRSLLGQPLQVKGSGTTADQWAQVQDSGVTWVLREVSSATHTIAGTIELQIGTHSCEYKFARTEQERAHEEQRVAAWEPDSTEERQRAQNIRRRFELGQDPGRADATEKLVGGSYGRKEKVYYASLDDFTRRNYHEQFFKNEAWTYFLGVSKDLQLLFLNRNFSGSRVDTQRQEKGAEKMTSLPAHDLSDGLATVSHVLDYKTDQGQDTTRIKELVAAQGKKIPSGRVTGEDVPAISVGRLFWQRFQGMDANAQIKLIDDSVGRHGQDKAPLEVAAQLRYRGKQQRGDCEPVSELHISDVKFVISSAHSYKFHEQSLESHPGLAGTQKEVELAIMQQALARYRAKALPRSGAVGGISDAKYSVIVNGVKIVYLAWSPAPGSGLIYIPDYMAVGVNPL